MKVSMIMFSMKPGVRCRGFICCMVCMHVVDVSHVSVVGVDTEQWRHQNSRCSTMFLPRRPSETSCHEHWARARPYARLGETAWLTPEPRQPTRPMLSMSALHSLACPCGQYQVHLVLSGCSSQRLQRARGASPTRPKLLGCLSRHQRSMAAHASWPCTRTVIRWSPSDIGRRNVPSSSSMTQVTVLVTK